MSAFRKIAAVSALLMATTPVLAASDYLLQLDTVKGEAAPATIEVQSFSWGVSNSGTAGPRGTGKVSMQDISMTSAPPPRDVATGAASGKRAAPVAEASSSATAAPAVGDDASFTVVTPAGAADKAGACASGTHFPHAVIVARGQRYEFSDVVVTSCTVANGQMKKEFKGHVTLLK
jgi:hypothetical protein